MRVFDSGIRVRSSRFKGFGILVTFVEAPGALQSVLPRVFFTIFVFPAAAVGVSTAAAGLMLHTRLDRRWIPPWCACDSYVYVTRRAAYDIAPHQKTLVALAAFQEATRARKMMHPMASGSTMPRNPAGLRV